MKKRTSFKALTISLGFVIASTALVGCASLERNLNSIGSEFTGGQNRTISVYSNDGDLIKEYNGKFDITDSESEVYFMKDGKPVIIHGGTVIIEGK